MQMTEKYEAPWIEDLIADVYCDDVDPSIISRPQGTEDDPTGGAI